METIEEVAHRVYETQRAANNKVSSLKWSSWENLDEDIRQRNIDNMYDLYMLMVSPKPPMILDNREKAQIAHALYYAEHFQPAGIPGHGQLILIAKLARALGLS